MDSRISQQTSVSLQLPSQLAPPAYAPPEPAQLQSARPTGLLQWALEGSGWRLLRPVSDFVMALTAVLIAIRGLPAPARLTNDQVSLLGLPFLIVALFYVRGLYRSRLRTLLLDGLVPVLSTVSIAAMGAATADVLLGRTLPGQGLWVRAWVLTFVAVSLGRGALVLLQRWARREGLVGKPVLIFGAGIVGSHVARRLTSHPEYGLIPVGFLDESPAPEVGDRELPVLGDADDLDDIVARTGARTLLVAFSSTTDDRVSRVIQRCQASGVDVSVVPRMFDTINNRVGYETVGGLPLLSFKTVQPDGVQFAIKHALDRVVALALLAVLAPLMICIAVAVRLSSPGPVLFHQPRVGRDGRLFDLYKFRSMRPPAPGEDADPSGELDFVLARGSAPGGVEGQDRRTAVGRLLRRTSLDELPQLFNVLRGEMSIVGPRPERPEFVELFRQDIARYGDRHRVKAGITGWAQVHGLRGQTSLVERVEWDNYYIAHWSLGLDLKILALTVAALLHNAE